MVALASVELHAECSLRSCTEHASHSAITPADGGVSVYCDHHAATAQAIAVVFGFELVLEPLDIMAFAHENTRA